MKCNCWCLRKTVAGYWSFCAFIAIPNYVVTTGLHLLIVIKLLICMQLATLSRVFPSLASGSDLFVGQAEKVNQRCVSGKSVVG